MNTLMLTYLIRISGREIPGLPLRKDGAKRNQRDLPLKTSHIKKRWMSMFVLEARD
jgi:hypothetical protein